MNIERLKLVRQAILDNVDNFNYNHFLLGPLAGLLHDDCGTVGCVAGFACALFCDGYGEAAHLHSAEMLLSLSEPQADFLFYGEESACGTMPFIDLAEATANDAIARIDFLLEGALS